MDLEFDYFVRRFKGGGLGSLVEYHVVPVHLERSAVSSSTARASDNASRASAAVLFSVQSAMSESLAGVIIPFGLGILSFMYP